MPKLGYTILLKDVSLDDANTIGSDFAKLASLIKQNFNTPDAFIVTSAAFYHFLKENNLNNKLKHLFDTINFENPKVIAQVSEHMRNLVLNANLDKDLVKEIARRYRKLGSSLEEPVINLHIFENLKNHSSSLEVFKNVEGDAILLERIKTCFSLIFTPQLLINCHKASLSPTDITVSVMVSKKLNGKYSGVLYTSKPSPFDKSKMVIDVRGEGIVEVSKNDLKIENSTQMPDSVLLKITKEVKKLEEYFYFPQQIDWVLYKNSFYIENFKDLSYSDKTATTEVKQNNFIEATPVAKGIVSGNLKKITDLNSFNGMSADSIVILNFFTKELYGYLRYIKGIILDSSVLNDKDINLLKLLSIPIVAASTQDIESLNPKLIYTINGTSGHINSGGAYRNDDSHLVRETVTKIYANSIGLDSIDNLTESKNDGVFILDGNILIKNFGYHPKKIINDNDHSKLINFLVSEINQFAKKVYPARVIYKISDLTTSEHLKLIGGKDFEGEEINPHFGYRGGLRHSLEGDVLDMELTALKKVLLENSFMHLEVMFSFIRTTLELKNLVKTTKSHELDRFSNFKIWTMIQTPFNLLMLEEFMETGVKGICLDYPTLISFLFGYDTNNLKIYNKVASSDAIDMWILQRLTKNIQKYNVECIFLDNDILTRDDLIEKITKLGILGISVLPNQVEELQNRIKNFEKRLLYK